ncbi:hypothetical protein [Streptomyces sp. AHA2]|uniref:hypothetical protein n=1 Tax=Streptomyces sp. AHA2 TaxID=3064526 RepID=UPI002FE376C6
MHLEKPSREQAAARAEPHGRTAEPHGRTAEPPGRVPEEPGGCLTVAVRIPVRIVVLVAVVPVRMLWDALAVAGRFLDDVLLRPLGRALLRLARTVFVWPFVGLWRYVAVPVGKALARLGHVLLVVPAVWLHRHLLAPLGHAAARAARGVWTALGRVYTRLLTPAGHALAWVVKGLGAVLAALGVGLWATSAWLVRHLVVVPAVWLYTWVLAPVGRAVARCGRGLVWLVGTVVGAIATGLYRITRILFVVPALALWRRVLAPAGHVLAVVGREVGDALGHAWRVAGYLSLAVGRFLATCFRWIFVEPVRWAYRSVLTPVGHAVRDTVLRPAAAAARAARRTARQALAAARDSARQARADLRRTLFGEPGRPRPVDRREPSGREPRTLGNSTTALTKD